MTAANPPAPGDVDDLSFEQARDELVRVVAALEQGAPTLEESLRLWERGESLAARCGETQACYQRGLEHVPRESVCCGGRAPRRSSRSRPSSTQMIQKMTRRPRGFRIAQVVCERGVRNLLHFG